MKFQLVILCSLLAIAFTLPVPDEEVSVVRPVVPEVPDAVKEVENRPVEVVQPEVRAALTEDLKKPIEVEKKIDLPVSIPDAEIAPVKPETVAVTETKQEAKLEEPKEEKPEELPKPVEMREVKQVSVVEAPVANVGEEKQVVQEGSSVVHEVVVSEAAIQPEGKSSELPVEQPQEALKTTDKDAALTPEAVATPIAALTEEQKPAEETAPRQERISVVQDKVEEKPVDNVQVIKPSEEAAATPEVVAAPSLKSLTIVEPDTKLEAKSAEETVIEGEAPKAPELKVTAAEEKPATSGDIAAEPQTEDLSKAKDLKVEPEAAKIDESLNPAAPIAPVDITAEIKKVETPIEVQTAAPESPKLEETPAPAAALKDSSEESKEVKEKDSSESKESEESNESAPSGEKTN